MAQTPNTTATPYASGSDLVIKRDWRTVGDLITDDDTRPANAAAVAASSVVADAMLTASGEIESSCYYGGRYSTADLTALTGAGQALLKQICCDLAFWILKKRRSPSVNPDQVSGAMEAFEKLDKLRLGEKIFPFTETADASLGESHQAIDPNSTTNPPISSIARRYFGGRSNDTWQ